MVHVFYSSSKNFIQGIWRLWYEKELLPQKKVLWEPCDAKLQLSPNNFLHNNFDQPNVNSLNYFNSKEPQVSVTNKISNKTKNTNQNLDIEGLIDLRKMCSINQLKQVCRKASIHLLYN